MPVDATIALQGRPAAVPDAKIPETFLTLGQLKALQARTEIAQQQAAREQQTFEEPQRLADFLRGGGAARPTDTIQSQSLPTAPGDGSQHQQAPQQAPPDLTDPGVQAQLYALGPHVAREFIGGALEAKGKALGLQSAAQKLQLDQLALGASQLEMASRGLPLIDQSPDPARAYAAWRMALASHVAPQTLGMIPETYQPGVTGRLQQMAQSIEAQIGQRVKQQELAIQQTQAESQRIAAEAARLQAQSGALRAENEIVQGPSGVTIIRPRTAEGVTVTTPQSDTAGRPVPTTAMRTQENLLQERYLAGTKDFEASTSAYNTIQASKDAHTNPADKALVVAFQRLLDKPGSGLSAEELGTLKEQFSGEYSKLFSGKGALEGPVRQKLLDTAKRIHAAQVDQHLQFRDQLRQQAREQGLSNPEMLTPSRASATGQVKQRMSQADFRTFVDRYGQGRTPGQIWLDLKEQGIQVEGGP